MSGVELGLAIVGVLGVVDVALEYAPTLPSVAKGLAILAKNP
jgi:hypothetical protein